MISRKTIKTILAILNMREDSSFAGLSKFLRQAGLCDYLLITDNGQKIFSLFTMREAEKLEVKVYQEGGPIPPTEPGMLQLEQRLRKIAPNMRLQIIFPEDMGQSGGQQAVRAFHQVANWFRAFINGCMAGRMDIAVLNRFKQTRGLVLEFTASANPLRPQLSVAELNHTSDDLIERKILSTLIYPFIFSQKGGELARIRQCRRCGVYFKAARLSASYCSNKCRMEFHYLKRKQ